MPSVIPYNHPAIKSAYEAAHIAKSAADAQWELDRKSEKAEILARFRADLEAAHGMETHPKRDEVYEFLRPGFYSSGVDDLRHTWRRYGTLVELLRGER